MRGLAIAGRTRLNTEAEWFGRPSLAYGKFLKNFYMILYPPMHFPYVVILILSLPSLLSSISRRAAAAKDIATYREAILSLEEDHHWRKAIDILDEADTLTARRWFKESLW